VSSDVGDFTHAIERGDFAGAVEEYRGPFLDGFYLTDAPEFEEWLSAERSRLERSYLSALEKLANGAEAANDHAGAVNWWRKLADTDRVSSRNAAGLMRALMNAGDHVAALQYAEQYESIVQQQLGTSVGPAVASLVNEARTKMANRTAVPVKLLPTSPQREQKRATQHETPSVNPIPAPQEQSAVGRRLYSAILLASLVLITAALWLRRPSSSEPSTATGSTGRLIAVFPFTNVNGDRQDEALVQGLSEEMLTVLAKIPNLRVMSRASASAFRNARSSATGNADSVGVTNILEGSVQRSGSRLRVQVRLLDARNSTTIWSETYDRELKDIFAVQSDIAAAIARELDLRLGTGSLARIRHGSTQNVAAYELYLRGSDPALTRSDSAAQRGMEYFRQAIALDSNFAAAYAGFARLRVRNPYGSDGREVPLRERVAVAQQAINRAIALDDSLSEAHAIQAMISRFRFDMVTAESELKKAIALDPANARSHEFLVLIYVLTDRPADALIEGRKAVQLDPLSPTATAQLAYALSANNRCDEALAELAKLKSLRPPLLRAASIAAGCYAEKKMWPEAIAELERVSPASGPRGQAELGYMLARSGRTAEARQILDSLLERDRRLGEGAFEVALVYAGLKETDETFAWLNRATREYSMTFEWMPSILNDLRSDPRMKQNSPYFGVQKR
jgi:TolB-like protein